MAKVTFTFLLPDDEDDFRCAVDGRGAHAVLWEMDSYLRSRLKYGELSSDVADALQKVRDELHRNLDERGVSLER